jgi:F-type H+-transporting ATPase subunit b
VWCGLPAATVFQSDLGAHKERMEILGQLVEFVLQALPTLILVLLLFLVLRRTFFGPLERVMAERARRTEGARKEAEAAQAAAQERIRSYQEALKKARAELYAEQDAARRAVLEERARLTRETRARGQDMVRAAKERLAADVAAARKQLEEESQSLGAEIARAILGRGKA